MIDPGSRVLAGGVLCCLGYQRAGVGVLVEKRPEHLGPAGDFGVGLASSGDMIYI